MEGNAIDIVDYKSVAAVKEIELNEAIYNEACNILGQIYHYNGLVSLGFSINDGHYELGRNKITDPDLNSLFDKESIKRLRSYVNSHKRFRNNPYAYVEMFLFNNDGTLNKAYKKVEDCHKVQYDVDLRSGRITLFRPYPKIKGKEGEKVKELVRIICNYDDKMVEAVLRFMAFLVFEHGIGKSGRPSLILYGDRGTGKNFLVEHIINRMIPSMSIPLPSNFMQFNGFVEKKFIYLDENELQENMGALSRLAKRLSGGIEEAVNKKGQQVYNRKINTHFCVLSNKQPIRIEERPLNEGMNQWIVLKMQRPLQKDPYFIDFCNENGPDLSPWIEDNIGSFMFDVLLPIYKETKAKYTNYRYGFPIPINEALNELISLSIHTYESESLNILAELMYNSVEDYINMFENVSNKKKLIELIKWFKEDGFFAYPLRDALCTIRRCQISNAKLKMSLQRANLWGTGTKVDCQVYLNESRKEEQVYGVKLDLKTVREFFKMNDINYDDDFQAKEANYERFK